jgi:hypothetical protein
MDDALLLQIVKFSWMEYLVRWQLLDVGKVRVGETVDKEHVWSELG